MSQLTIDQIKPGALIGLTGIGFSGNRESPGLITRVFKKRGLFFVTYLYNMWGPEPYNVGITESSPESRTSMRPASTSEVAEFLEKNAVSLEAELAKTLLRVTELRRVLRKNVAFRKKHT